MTMLTVPLRVVQRLDRACEVPFTLFAVPDTLADGVIVGLQTAARAVLGLGVVDREAASVRVLAWPPDAAIDAAWADRRLERAMALRACQGLTGSDRAFRLLNGAGDHVPGVLVDLYGTFAVVSASTPALRPVADLLAQGLIDRRVARGVVVKRRGRGGAAAGPAVDAVLGETPPEKLRVREGPWQFEVHLTTGVNVGLFTDMREERRRLTAMSAGRRVLNLFAYTGALSVAAASGGASHVTSVDLSEGVLAWARDHFTMNGLDAGAHTTVAADTGDWLRAAAERRERFDLVLIDPPSYSAARAGAFAIDRDYAPIVRMACERLSPGGDLWLASNTRGFSLAGVAQAAVPASRRPRLVAQGGLPADYPTEPADVEARYLQTCLLRLL